MKKRLIGATFITVLAALLVSTAINIGMMRQDEISGTTTELHAALAILDMDGYDYTPEELILQFSLGNPDKRITVIQEDGTVLADSELDYHEMENHEDRVEVIAAFASGWGESTRYSSSTQTTMVYVAKAFDEGFVVRASMPIDNLMVLLGSNLWALVIAAVVALGLSMLMIRPIANRALEPLTLVGEALQGVLTDNTATVAPKIKKSIYEGDESLLPIMQYIDRMVDQLEEHIQSLTDERNKVSLILDCMDEGHILLDEDGRILSSNGAARTLFGLPEDEDNPDFLMARNLRLKEAAATALLKRTAVVTDLDSYGQENRTLRLYVNPVTGHNFEGIPVGASVLISDVTALKKAEGIRAEFTANVSHELKTPLTSIKGFTDMLLSGVVKSEEDKTRFLTMMGVEVDRLIDLINDILRLSELESVTIAQEDSCCDVFAVAQEVVELLTPTAFGREITLEVEGNSALIPVPAHRMKEVLVNLVGNGIKYNEPKGVVEVLIDTTETDVVLKVMDTGIGIPPEAIDRVFERFYRVDKGRSRQSGGTGLGLAIVKHVVQLYGGTIKLISTVGGGSTFTIILPLVKS